MREAVACHEQYRIGRKEPDVNEVEDCNVIAEVEEEVMPGTLLVGISAEREQIQPLKSICNMNPSKTHVISIFSRWVWRGPYSGDIPNKSADTNSDITPKKNETFSRVRTTFAECHDVTSNCIRAETCIRE